MKRVKRFSAGLAALALMAVLPLGMTADVVASDYTPVNYNDYILWDELEGIPDGLTLVAEDIRDSLTSDKAYELVFGEDGIKALDQMEDDIDAEYERVSALDISEDEKDAMLDEIVSDIILDTVENKLGYWASSYNIIDLHLEDAQHNKVPYDGDEVTIVFERAYEMDPMSHDRDIEQMLKASENKWEYAELHIKDDGTREFLPLIIDNATGKGTLKTTSFSTFIPVYRVIKEDEEEEAPKTLDDTNISVGAAVIGVAGLLTLGLFVARKERK